MTALSTTAILEMRGIEKSFTGTHALRGVDFSCDYGEVHGLVGENGAGKSTLLKILAGIYEPDNGKIVYCGEECLFSNYSKARKSGIGVVYQELSLLPQLSVAENIVMGIWPRNKFGIISWKEIKDQAVEILNDLGVEIQPDLLVSSLPMASRQMVEIAKMLIQKPKLIIFDEPTAPLSHDEVEYLFAIIRKLKVKNKGIIFVSHRLDEVLSISDRITVMKDGKRIITEAASWFDEKKLISSMVGRELSQIFPEKLKGSQQYSQTMFSYTGKLDKSRSPINFEVKEGEVVGVGGLQGQGQIELLQAIFGLGGCSDLHMRLSGKEIRVNNPRQAIKHGIALIPENRNEEGVFLILSALENLTAPTLKNRQRFGFIKLREEREEVEEIINKLSIKVSSHHQIAQSLSGGNMQKLVIGKWLMFNPKLIVLIEPTKGVDVATKQQIYLLIRQLARQGVAVILNTSDMLELIALCDRVLVINQGILTANLTDADITEGQIMEASVHQEPYAIREAG